MFNSGQWWNNNKYWCVHKKRHVSEKDYIWNPATCICENQKDLGSITAYPVITGYKFIDVEVKSNDGKTETFPKMYLKKVVYKKQSFYILLEFLLINIELLIVVII